MLFSILVAHYNNYDYFLDCYESILKQTYQDFEVIILDDCSTDDSFEKIKELTRSDTRFRLFQNEENQGVGFTKRKCVELAFGEICGFLDPDDALVPEALEISVKNYSDNKIIGTYSLIKLCDEKLDVQKIFPNTRKIKSDDLHFFNINFEIAHFFTFRKSAYNKISGINPKLQVAEDIDLYLQLYDTGQIQFIPKPLYLYRLHNNGLSHTAEKQVIKQKNWHQVILQALERRKIDFLYGKRVNEIDNLPEFIFKKQNTFFKKILRKFS